MSDQGLAFDPNLLFEPERVVWPANWAGHVPFAAWLVKHQRPEMLVELGTHNGLSYSAFCQAIQEAAVPARCYAVDTWQGDEHSGFYGEHVYADLRDWHDARYSGFSRLLRQTFDEAVTHFEKGSIDLLHIDGLHTYEAVKHDFETWRHTLTSRGIVLFHDTQVRERDFGVWRLWDELSAEYPHLRFDHSNGLGVLLVGDQQPEAIRALHRQYQHDPAGIRRLFRQLGERVELKAHCRELQRQRREYDEHAQREHAQRVELEERRQQELAALREQCETARRIADDRAKQLDDLLESRSWRLTAPLRWLAARAGR